MNNEDMLNRLIGKVQKLELLRNVSKFTETNRDYETYILETEIRELETKILSRMEVKLYV